MSKWIKKELFESFQKEKIEEKDNQNSGFIRSNLVWDTPEKGSTETAKVYEGRFLPDPEGEFYKTYFYHMWKSGDSWKFVFCPKTRENYKEFCPICSAVSKLYNGTKDDKAQGYQLKKKERNVSNFFIKKDNRDDERLDENKVVGKVRLYEFPGKVEQKVKKEITNITRQGYGSQIFDPGEDGRDFIINVLSTKPDDKGKTWPDYSTSDFSRLQEALGTDEEIEAILATCTNLKEYIESLKTDKDKIVEILKGEFLWDLVETECLKNGYSDVESGAGRSAAGAGAGIGAARQEPQREEPRRVIPINDSKEEETPEPPRENTDLSQLNDDELLAELDNM